MRPWLSVWLKPGDTIERVLAGRPQHSIWVLAALGGIASLFEQLIAAKLTTDIIDWRIIAAVALGGALAGLIGLYIYALFFRWSGRMFGGRAAMFELRAMFAWSALPYVAGFAICFAILVLLKWSGSPAGASTTLSTALTSITAAFSLWSFVISLLMLARLQHFGFWRTIASALVGWVLLSLLLILPIAFRTLLFQPFSIPSASNLPTVLVGDYIFASKYAYGYSRFSLPFSPPLFSGRIWGAEPQRGDFVVYRLPKDTTTDYIKRVVGLPGDRIQMISGLLHINGAPVKREQIENFIDTDDDGKTTKVKQWRETLPNGVSHTTLDLIDNGFADITAVYMVPPGHYFMMGDNRDNSVDSRFSQIGTVPFENLIGRATIIYYSRAPATGSTPAALRFDRIGTTVR